MESHLSGLSAREVEARRSRGKTGAMRSKLQRAEAVSSEKIC